MTTPSRVRPTLRQLRDAVDAIRQSIKTDPIEHLLIGGAKLSRLQRELLDAYDALLPAEQHLSQAVYEQEGLF